MKLLIFILTVNTFPLVRTATSMESLLRAQIMAARCEARCNMEENNLERREAMQCREVCSLLLSTTTSTTCTSSFPLCSSPLLCARGCQTACNPPPPAPAFFLSPLSLSPCSITWHLSTSQPAIFLLGAEDAGGKLHLVATTSASFLPRIHIAASYTSLQLLAVTSTGVVARSQLLLDDEVVEEEEEVKCNKEEPVQQSTAEPQQHITFNFDLKLRNVLSFALPGCLGLVLLCLLILLLFRRLRSSQDLDHVESQVEEMRRRRRSQEVDQVVEVNEVCTSHRSLPLLHPQMEPLTSIPKKFDTNSPSTPLDHFYEEIGKPYALTRVASFVRK